VPRYYFHLYDDIECKDDEGKDLPDLAAARDHAVSDARAIVAEEIQAKGEFSLSHWIEIEDESGEVVLIVKFADAVNIKP